MQCLKCGSENSTTKCASCGYDIKETQISTIWSLSEDYVSSLTTEKKGETKQELTEKLLDVLKSGVSTSPNSDTRSSNQMTYSKYSQELEKLCRACTIADFDIQMLLRRGKLNARYGITIEDVKKDIKAIIEPICRKANIDLKTIERYTALRQKYARYNSVTESDHEEYKEYIALEEKITRKISGQMTYSLYIKELEEMCKDFTIADFDIQEFVRRNRLESCFGITVNDVKTDIKAMIEPMCEKANIDLRTIERYTELRQKYARLDNMSKMHIAIGSTTSTYGEYKEFLELENRLTV